MTEEEDENYEDIAELSLWPSGLDFFIAGKLRWYCSREQVSHSLLHHDEPWFIKNLS